jgi:hypothetical protein
MTTPAGEDEWGELYDATIPRNDLVGKGANGVPGFLLMKQDAAAGLLDPSDIRGLIAKSPQETSVPEPSEAGETTLPNGIVIKGSPADMAAFFNAANARPTPADVAKAKNDTADREKKAASGAAMPDGSYPIANEADLKKAVHAVGRGGADHNAIRKHVIARARSLGASSEIPDNWNSDGSLKGDVSKEADVPESVAKDVMDAAGDAVPLDDGMDGMDPTTPFAAPDDESGLPGDPTDPGSPAWEGIDAATAHKWLAIAARLKNALLLLAERESLEAASADPDDIENAWSLEDAAAAVDYAIGNLAVFASGEKAEAEIGAECEEMCKALAAFDTAPLGVIEGLTAVAKSGRVLSSANEAAIRAASESLQKVLASLPEAPVAKQKEGAMPATTAETPAEPVAKADGTPASPEAQARDSGPVNAGGTTGMGAPRTTGPAEAAPADGPQGKLPGDVPGRAVVKSSHLNVVVYDRAGKQCHVRPDAIVQPVAKADGDADAEKPKMQAVFDQDGDLIGVVDPDAITPVAGAAAAPAADPAAPAPAADDDTPQPPAAAGIPADAVGKSAEQDVTTGQPADLESIIAKAVTAALSAVAPAEDVAKSADVAAANARADALEARIAKVEESPAAPKVFTNGQVPPAEQLRGQDAGAPPSAIAKAAELKRVLYEGSPSEQNNAANEMQRAAIDALTAIHAGAR